MLLNEEMLKYIIYAIEGEHGLTCITLCHEVVVTQRAQFSDRTELIMENENKNETEMTINNDIELKEYEEEKHEMEEPIHFEDTNSLGDQNK